MSEPASDDDDAALFKNRARASSFGQNAQRYDEADKWAETYGRRRRTVIAGGRPYFVRNPMFGLPRTMR